MPSQSIKNCFFFRRSFSTSLHISAVLVLKHIISENHRISLPHESFLSFIFFCFSHLQPHIKFVNNEINFSFNCNAAKTLSLTHSTHLNFREKREHLPRRPRPWQMSCDKEISSHKLISIQFTPHYQCWQLWRNSIVLNLRKISFQFSYRLAINLEKILNFFFALCERKKMKWKVSGWEEDWKLKSTIINKLHLQHVKFEVLHKQQLIVIQYLWKLMWNNRKHDTHNSGCKFSIFSRSLAILF
jgi:hypothetical protein